MRNVNSHLSEVKMDEAVTHYINSHQTDEHGVHVDASSLALNVQDDGSRVTVMHSQSYIPLCRQISVGDHEADGQWGEELLDPDGRLAALVAQIAAQQPRGGPQHSQHKEPSVRADVDTSVILDSSMRLFSGHTLDHSEEPIVVEVPHLPSLPALQGMKRCTETDWFNNKSKTPLKDQSTDPIVVDVPHLPPLTRLQGLKRCPEPDWNIKTKTVLKNDASIVSDSDGSVLELGPASSPAHIRQQSKKSLPHKKRISRKLKKNGGSTPQQDIVVLNCTNEGAQEVILPDSFAPHHISHEIRPVLLCQLCGAFYGEEQLKFYQHLKQHYEPHSTIIIENPVPDLAIDKMTNSCIVDNVATLPDSIVELSLENTVPKTIYQSMDKHILYSTSDKTLNYTNHKPQYSVASMDKEPNVVPTDAEKNLYETLEKLDLYNCPKCNKTFRKQKQCEAHIKEAHSMTKLEEMAEFSEPEDLMEGIHVSVEEGGEQYEQTLLPHITVENGHVHQEHVKQWYQRHGGAPDAEQLKVLKEEVIQRILESETAPDAANYQNNIIPNSTEIPPPAPPTDEGQKGKKKSPKRFECPQCARVFLHRNSLLYHMLSHSSKQQVCRDCGKGFYTQNALKIHRRVHNGDRPFKCEICGREFRQWSDLKYHKVSIHSSQKLFKCEFCDKEFARKYSLNVHRRIHTGERNYKCEFCNKSFRASSYRLSHMRTHTGDKPYKCSQCEKCFRVAGDMRRHMRTHDKMRNRLDAQKSKTTKPQKETKKPIKPDEEEQKAEFKVVRKIAVASTTKAPIKSADKKTVNKKRPLPKRGAPNVTIDQLDADYTNNVEVFDTRQDNYKFKEVYDGGYKEDLEFDKEMIQYKPDQTDRDLAMLRPMFRNGDCDNEVDKSMYRSENTDGKMQIFTHIVKGKEYNSVVSNSQLTDMRQLDREVRSNIQGENIETCFLERLTALYNISAV